MDMKLMGLGTSGIGNLYKKISSLEADQTLQAAWDGGFRYFDTAPLYGHGLSERRVGDFLRGRPRNEFTLSTKAGRLLKPMQKKVMPEGVFVEPLPFNVIFDYTYDGIMRSYEDSLQRLGLDRIDRLFIHDIGAYTHKEQHAFYLEQLIHKGGMEALQKLKEEGEIQEIGVGVNETQILETLFREVNIDTILLAGCFNLLRNAGMDTFFSLVRRLNKKLILAGVFGSGVLIAKSAASRKFDYQPPSAKILAKVEKIHAICQKYSVPAGAAAIQFPLRHIRVDGILVGAQSAGEVQDILAWQDVTIPSELWSELRKNNIIECSV